MRYMTFVLMLVSFFAIAADGPDIDMDGHPEAFFDDEGKFVASEDNCPTIYNPEQTWGKSWVYNGTDAYEWRVNKSDGGVACSLDVNGDGTVDQHDFFAVTSYAMTVSGMGYQPYPLVRGAIGDFGGTPESYDLVDACYMYKYAYLRGIYFYIGNTEFLKLCKI